MGTATFKASPNPALFGATVSFSQTPAPKAALTPAFYGAIMALSHTPPKYAPKPLLHGACLTFSSSPTMKMAVTPSLYGAIFSLEHQGAASIPTTTGSPLRLLGALLALSQSDVISYDATNRMVDAAWRDKDHSRFGDAKQLFGNQRYFVNRFTEDHDPTTGAHSAKALSTMSGHRKFDGLPHRAIPDNIGDTTLHLAHNTGPTVSRVYLTRLDVGSNVEGVFEAVQCFGGERSWSSYVAVKKITARGL